MKRIIYIALCSLIISFKGYASSEKDSLIKNILTGFCYGGNIQVINQHYSGNFNDDCQKYIKRNNIEEKSLELLKLDMFNNMMNYMNTLNNEKIEKINIKEYKLLNCQEKCSVEDIEIAEVQLIRDLVREFCYSDFTEEQYLKYPSSSWRKIEFVCEKSIFKKEVNLENEFSYIKVLLNNK